MASPQEPDYPPPGKTAIVTGGSSGIGRCTAIALARAGWNVCVTGRREAELQTTVAALELAANRPGVGHYVVGDISTEDVVIRVFRETAARYTRIDLVFANAGISPPAVPIAEQSAEDWHATVAVNLTAPYLCAREAFRYMAKQVPAGGRIVLNGSVSAYAPRPYTATKHAITGLAKTLSLDGRPYRIATTQLDVGNAASALTVRMAVGPGVRQPDGSFRREPTFDPEWVAREVVHVAEMPLGVNVANVVIQATNMPSHVGRG